jgi:hypothetical protein
MMVSFISHIANAPPQECQAGLCRAESRLGPVFRTKSHTARHNPVPGIMPIMPGAA